jgi:5-methyltetrahydropteroyltriglutamate--homocysteine methyltransferase
MFTATEDLMLPTTVAGSWPRPRWYRCQLQGEALSTRLKDVAYREQFTDALAVAIDEQERAGLDILTHADYFHDEDIGGQSWLLYPMERWSGLAGDHFRLSPDLPDYEPGEILDEVIAAMRWPRVVGKIEASAETPLEYAKIWRLAQVRSAKPIRFGTVCVQALNLFLDLPGGPYDSDDRRRVIWDMAETMNKELRELAAAGCNVIQVEEPHIHALACYHPEQTDFIDFLVDASNREVEGLDDVEVWVHTCWGNPNMQKGLDNISYANSIETYLERLNADVWTIESKEDEGAELHLFAPYKNTLKKKIALGVVSHRTVQVEKATEVADLTRKAMQFIPPENLILSSDCGFGRQGTNRVVAYYKAAAIARGANIIRRELGVEERYVPAADPVFRVEGNPALQERTP